MKRFVFRAYHPQFFNKPGKGNLHKHEKEFRETYGRTQDLTFNMAAQFVDLKVNLHYFELDHRIGSYPRLSGPQRELSAELDETFREQMRKAFPQRFEDSWSRMARLREGKSDLQAQIETAFNELSAAPLADLTQQTSGEISAEELVGCYLVSSHASLTV